MAKTVYKFFFQSNVTVNLLWHGFRHIFTDFLLTSAKFWTVKTFFRQKMKFYTMMNVTANFHLIVTKEKGISGGGWMVQPPLPPPASHRLFDPQKSPAFVELIMAMFNFQFSVKKKKHFFNRLCFQHRLPNIVVT